MQAPAPIARGGIAVTHFDKGPQSVNPLKRGIMNREGTAGGADIAFYVGDR
jgi:hypothetical protein